MRTYLISVLRVRIFLTTASIKAISHICLILSEQLFQTYYHTSFHA